MAFSSPKKLDLAIKQIGNREVIFELLLKKIMHSQMQLQQVCNACVYRSFSRAARSSIDVAPTLDVALFSSVGTVFDRPGRKSRLMGP